MGGLYSGGGLIFGGLQYIILYIDSMQKAVMTNMENCG